MKSIYNYQTNITVSTTATGDKVITMNKEIFTELLNNLFEAHDSYMQRDLKGLGENTLELWSALKGKSDESEPKIQSDYSDIRWAIRRHDNLTDAERDELIKLLKESK
jgi:hypothetical protein